MNAWCFWFISSLIISLAGVAESFPWELRQKRAHILQAVGWKKLALMEEVARTKEIYRITELLLVDGIGEKTVTILGAIMGFRFGYEPTMESCCKEKIC